MILWFTFFYFSLKHESALCTTCSFTYQKQNSFSFDINVNDLCFTWFDSKLRDVCNELCEHLFMVSLENRNTVYICISYPRGGANAPNPAAKRPHPAGSLSSHPSGAGRTPSVLTDQEQVHPRKSWAPARLSSWTVTRPCIRGHKGRGLNRVMSSLGYPNLNSSAGFSQNSTANGGAATPYQNGNQAEWCD